MKKKSVEVENKIHPLKLRCNECGAEPFLLCKDSGAEWSSSLQWLHKSRQEAAELVSLFGTNE